MGTGELSGKPDKMLGGYMYLRWTSIPSRRNSNTPSRFVVLNPSGFAWHLQAFIKMKEYKSPKDKTWSPEAPGLC